MRRLIVTALAGLGVWAAVAGGEARAQPPYTRPAVSPYLNLLRRGSSPAINYYDLVRPQVEFRNSIQRLQQQQTDLSQDVAAGQQALPPLTTGHPAEVMNYGPYFMTMGGPTAGRRTVTAPSLPAAPAAPARPPQGARRGP
jgi:hypothetical protein